MEEKRYPEPTCGALIFNPKGEILLIKSHKWLDKYVMPGGHIEMGESIEDALKREIKEETNLEISNIEFICFQEFIFDSAFWKKKHFIFLDFSCNTESEDVKLDSEGHEYIWITLEKALETEVEPFTKRAIEKYLEKKKS
jgi:nucleoside triphosphatase